MWGLHKTYRNGGSCFFPPDIRISMVKAIHFSVAHGPETFPQAILLYRTCWRKYIKLSLQASQSEQSDQIFQHHDPQGFSVCHSTLRYILMAVQVSPFGRTYHGHHDLALARKNVGLRPLANTTKASVSGTSFQSINSPPSSFWGT